MVSPARLFARWLTYWAVHFVLFRVSARDEDARDKDAGGPDFSLMQERLANRASRFMCRTWDMDEPTYDATASEPLVFTSIC